VFSFFPFDKQVAMVDGAGRERMSKLLEAMPHDDRVDLLKRLGTEVVESLMPLVTKAERQDIRTLLSFPEGSAGSVMTTDFASLPADISAGDAITSLRQQAPSRETIYSIYVLDEAYQLLGFVSLRDLILAKPATQVADIMQREVISVRVDQDQEEAAQVLAKYNVLALPVVDDQHRLVGIITHDDVIDVMIEEATEDAQKMGGVVPIVEDYLEAPFFTIWRKRAAWLSCLFIAELFTFTALAHFEDQIAAILALSLFVPLCISTGGNSGSQAATLIIRAMAVGQITTRDWWRTLRHELIVGLALGLTLGVIGFVRASMTPGSVLGDANRWMLALVIAQSVAAICVWGTLVGSMLPLIFKRLGFDPGYASSPFVATFVDVTGIVIYFSIAKVCLL
jgi:magnesium transporter